jgi:hypothetical protein
VSRYGYHVCGHECAECQRIDEIDRRLEDARDNGILTVGELRRWLEGLDPEAHVIISLPPDLNECEHLNINDAILPNGDEFQALVLFGVDTFDPCQF